MNISIKFIFSAILLLTSILAYSQKSVEDSIASKKIKLDLNEIDENGLIGSEDGKHSVAYEFCIPLNNKMKKQVSKIDSSIKFFSGPTGRSGCSGQYLCIGEGGTKKVIMKLAKLGFIKVINPCYFE